MEINSLGVDLGNGFMKIVSKDNSLVEQAVYANVPQTDYVLATSNKYAINNEIIMIGDDAVRSRMNLYSAVGSINALDRYTSKEYLNLMIAFIFKFAGNKEVKIEKMVIGLPNNHFSSCAKAVKEIFQNKKFLINDEIVSFKSVEVIPQPLGAYFSNNLEKQETMIIDLGQGTVDYTHINSDGMLISMWSTEDGTKNLYYSILEYLSKIQPASDLKVEDIPNILENGLKSLKGLDIELESTYIDKLKEVGVQNLITPVIQKYNYLSKFDYILIVGGGAEVYKKQIQDKCDEIKNIMIVEKSQLTNAEGFYMFAENM